MPKPRVATNVLAMRGAFETHPERAEDRAQEPKCIGELGDAPQNLTEPEAACWRELCGMVHAGSVGSNDRVALEIFASLLAEYRESRRDFNTAKLLRLQSFLAAFGMTPADRSRVKVGKAKDIDPMEKLLAKNKG
jgi:hypothetical protein